MGRTFGDKRDPSPDEFACPCVPATPLGAACRIESRPHLPASEDRYRLAEV